MNILTELRKTYRKEWWHTKRLTTKEIDKYHRNLLAKDKIVYLWKDGLVGYVEFWFVTEQQLDEILHNDTWSPLDNDIMFGNICYGANLYIDEKYRGNKAVDKQLKRMFLEKANGRDLVWTRNKLNKVTKLFRRRGYEQ